MWFGDSSPYTRLHRLVFAADKKVLIPLTSSLYVPGRIKDTENVLVDIGTGYFVEKVRSSPQSPDG
jgi:prefoldin alpha subunit